jgi:glutamate/tyrosine decarboxylase-like PLP-dependent enzyme
MQIESDADDYGKCSCIFHAGAMEGEFLAPDEHNFDLLCERLDFMHKKLMAHGSMRPGMRDLDGVFKYQEMLQSSHLPVAHQSRAAAIEDSLEAFEGTIRPHHPHSLFNVAPSPMIDAVALSALTLINNPNAIWDLSSGKFNLIEQRILRYIGDMVGWPEPNGAFTSGGKATFMYAVKIGINRCLPTAAADGITDGRCVVLASPSAHFSLESVCNFLGLGTSACIRIPAASDGTIDNAAFAQTLADVIDQGCLVAAVVLAGGPLIDTRADSVKAVRETVTQTVQQAGLGYTPLIHIDCVVTWPWLAFEAEHDSEFTLLRRSVQEKITNLASTVREARYADSFGVDFHKTGLSPYSSSCFVTRNFHEFRRIQYMPDAPLPEEETYGQFCSFDRTLENSRNCTGIISAYYVLRRLGKIGLRHYIMRWMTISETLRELIRDDFQALGFVVNDSTLGMDVVLRLRLGVDDEMLRNIEAVGATAQKRYAELAMGFREWTISSDYCRRRPVPVLGYVPLYRRTASSVPIPSFLLYPNSLYTARADLVDVLKQLSEAVDQFLTEKDTTAVGRMDWEGRPLPPR